MAKLTSPLFSLSASGKLANLLCYRSRKKTQCVLKAYQPANRRTNPQLYSRTIFEIGVRKAKELSDGEKAYLDTLAKLYNNNPSNNIYLSMFLNAVKYSSKYSWKKYNRCKYGNPEEFTI